MILTDVPLWILFPNEPQWLSVFFYIFLNPITAIPTVLGIAGITIVVIRTRRKKKAVSV